MPSLPYRHRSIKKIQFKYILNVFKINTFTYKKKNIYEVEVFVVVTSIGVFFESGLKMRNFNKKFYTFNILKFFIQLKQRSVFDDSWNSAYTFYR